MNCTANGKADTHARNPLHEVMAKRVFAGMNDSQVKTCTSMLLTR